MNPVVDSLSNVFSFFICVFNFILIGGVIAAIYQANAAKKALRGQSINRLIDEWKDPEIYRSISYVNQLRREWKNSPKSEWDDLARQWVEVHAEEISKSPEQRDPILLDEWALRRNASQFLSKLGFLVEKGYLTDDELFYIAPEIGRYLIVLMPIEKAIQEFFSAKEPIKFADWDKPFTKLEFPTLSTRYKRWYARKGKCY